MAVVRETLYSAPAQRAAARTDTMNRRSHHALPGTALLCLAALLFCLWVSFGGGPEICFTAGCSLYRDFTVAGVSLWFVGAAAFAALGILAVSGRAGAGHALAAAGLVIDTCLLILMVLTAPCFNCMVTALFLLAVFLSFRSACSSESGPERSGRRGHSLILMVWGFCFLCNTGIVLKSQVPLYCLSDNADEAAVRYYFSPSCPACRQGIEQLSGSIDTAFFPVAENDLDVARVARMEEALARGSNMAQALAEARAADYAGACGPFGCGPLMLRLRLLCNKAHLLMEAGAVVPFVEYRGLPRHLSTPPAPAVQRPAVRSTDPPIPLGSVSGFCTGGGGSCEEDEGGFSPRPAR